MKKRIKIALLILAVLLTCIMVFTACNNTPDESIDGNYGDAIESDKVIGNENNGNNGNSGSNGNTGSNNDGGSGAVHTHSFGEWEAVAEATCKAEGLKKRSCSCGEEETQTISVLPHNETTLNGVEPTCTETGLSEGVVCSVCGDVIVEQQELNALGHTEVIDGKVEPTCTETGLTEGKHCHICDEILVKQEIIPANGHTEVKISAVEPTCTQTGLTAGKYCEVCESILLAQETVPAKSHTEVEIPAVEPTCTQTGLTAGKYCEVCESILLARETVPAKGHTEVEIPAVEPTCTETGLTAGKYCEVCESILLARETVPAKGHTEVEIPAVEPTYTSEGATAGKKCNLCNEILVKPSVISRYIKITPVYDGEILTVTFNQKAHAGDTVVISTTVSEGYIFKGWYRDGELVSSSLNYNLRLDDEDVTITASVTPGDMWDGSIASGFAGGSGTQNDPYKISTGEQLAYLSYLINSSYASSYNTKYYVLTNDIDLVGKNWDPIGCIYNEAGSADTARAFRGHFDGQGYTIYNLSIYMSDYSFYRFFGLFGVIEEGGYVTGVHIKGCNIFMDTDVSGRTECGAIAGRVTGGTITRCSSDGSISVATYKDAEIYVGGIFGLGYSSTVSDCYVKGTVSGSNAHANARVGGIAGAISSTTVTRCYTACSSVYAASTYYAFSGGIVGHIASDQQNEGTSYITSCLSVSSGEAYNYGGAYRYAGKIYGYSSAGSVTANQTEKTDTEAFYTDTLGWSSEVWDFEGVTEGELPELIR